MDDFYGEDFSYYEDSEPWPPETLDDLKDADCERWDEDVEGEEEEAEEEEE